MRMLRTSPRARRPVVVAGLALLGGCGGGGDGTTGPTTQPVATAEVALAPADIIVGQTSQATATLRDAAGTVLTGRTINWSSSNTAVATISSTGLVTGVTAGTSQISATSEGKSGQATITVNPDPAASPQVNNVTVLRNGQPVNLQQAVGDIDFAFTLQLPAGYSGTLTLSIDSVEFVREAVSAPAAAARLVAGSASPIVVTSERSLRAESARTSFVVGADQIRELPLLTNRSYEALIRVVPTAQGGTSVERRVPLTTANPLHAHMLYRIDGMPVTGQDGKEYTGGSGTGAVMFAKYGGEQIERLEVVMGPGAAQYGSSPGGVVNQILRIERTDEKFFPIAPALVEDDDLTFILNTVTVNGVVIDPQVTPLGGAFTTSVNYSGWANTPQQAQGLVPPQGVQFVQVPQPSPDLLGGAAIFGLADRDRFNLDNLGPHQLSTAQPVFTFLDRETTIGMNALDAMYGFGASWGQVGPDYQFAAGLRRNNLDDVTGVDPTYAEFFAAPVGQVDNLFTDPFRLGVNFTLSETNGSRGYTAGVRVRDGRGNTSDWNLTTSFRNRYTIDGSLSLDAGLGIDRASFGYTEQKGDLDFGSIPRSLAWNKVNFDASLSYDITASNSVVGLDDGFLSARASKDGQWGFGNGTLLDQFRILPSTGGPAGGNATVNVKSILDQIAANQGLTDRQGWYRTEFRAADVATQPLGDRMQPRVRRVLWDYTGPLNPSITYTAPVVPGTTANATLGGTDNVDLEKALVGIAFAFASSVFTGGQAYVPIGQIRIPHTDHNPVTALSMPISGVVPVGFWFFNPFTGVVSFSTFYRSNAGMLQLRDKAWNLSPVVFAPFSNTAPIPVVAFLLQAYALMSSTVWCPGVCAGGGTNPVDLTFRYIDSRTSGAPVFSKAAWFAIPFSGGGVVYPLGEAKTFTEAPHASGREITYPLSLDLKKYCGPAGSALIFAIGWSADGLWLIKINPFFSVVFLVPNPFSNRCYEA